MPQSKTHARPLPPDDVRRHYAKLLPPGQALAMEVLFALRTGVQSLDSRLLEWLGGDALTPGRLQVLMVLLANDRPVPQREIVQALKVSRPTVSDLVDVLQRDGHVTTEQGAEDKRQILVALTPEGRCMTTRLALDNAAQLRAEFAGLSDDELQVLAGLLARLLPPPG